MPAQPARPAAGPGRGRHHRGQGGPALRPALRADAGQGRLRGRQRLEAVAGPHRLSVPVGRRPAGAEGAGLRRARGGRGPGGGRPHGNSCCRAGRPLDRPGAGRDGRSLPRRRRRHPATHFGLKPAASRPRRRRIPGGRHSQVAGPRRRLLARHSRSGGGRGGPGPGRVGRSRRPSSPWRARRRPGRPYASSWIAVICSGPPSSASPN